jgi:hypothetical protein
MPLSWNEIRDRALTFSKEWAQETSEDAEAKSFWDAFFYVFGITRRRIASFETPVKKSDGKGGYIDLLWKGVLLVEHKSKGKDLDRAFHQATDYFPGLKERDLPRYVVVSDFARLRLYDLDENEVHEFALAEFYKHIRLFAFIAGYQTRSFGAEDPVNVKAAEQLGRLHDLLEKAGYTGHPLEVFLVRILFCLFADDTSIFELGAFRDYIERRTSEDGSDLGLHLAQLFQVLNTPPETRLTTLDEQIAAFPYVNGKLFAEMLPLSAFNSQMRETLLDCAALDWSRISPAVFGSLFQSIMDKKARRDLGAHYTSEANILKVLKPLFLDELRGEFERVKRNPKRLREFHARLAAIRVLDPACGCGNFLVLAYRELRVLELDVLRELHKRQETAFLNIGLIFTVDVDQLYGIEVEEWPAQIAQVALWLTDHQMNMRASEEFGRYFVRLPLNKAPTIVQGDALAIDWKSVLDPKQASYIVGNPPFIGKKEQAPAQKAQVLATFQGVNGAGVLDYVSCWYQLATTYLAHNPSVRAAFVSTNSITQGEQVGVLWPGLFAKGLGIHFAHRTFQWTSEARGKAAVHCIIVGFGLGDVAPKWLFDYPTPKAEPHALRVENINAYLVPAANVFIQRRSTPVVPDVPQMHYGSMPIDNGWLTLTQDEAEALVSQEPDAASLLRQYIGADEFLYGVRRYCLWLVDADPKFLRQLPTVIERVEGNRKYRLSSNREATRKLAAVPGLFGEIRQPTSKYLVVPKVSSENRTYIPIGFCEPEVVASGSTLLVPDATLYDFGVLTSAMHNSWMRAVCGRMKSDYQYSATIVYNNFPWPNPTPKQRRAIEQAAQAVLDVRGQYPSSTLADLYDRLSTPPALTKAHTALDKAVDAAYACPKFSTEAERVAFVFGLYETIATPLAPAPTKKRKVRI